MTLAWNHGFQYHAWKGQALLLLALGRRNGALRRFEQMLSSNSPVIAKAVSTGRLSAVQKTPWALMDT